MMALALHITLIAAWVISALVLTYAAALVFDLTVGLRGSRFAVPFCWLFGHIEDGGDEEDCPTCDRCGMERGL